MTKTQTKVDTNMKTNYSLILEKTLADIDKSGTKPRLLIQSCCAPCSSYVLEYISRYFDLTLYFCNPNISPREEYDFRLSELERFVRDAKYDVKISSPDYAPEEFYAVTRGLEELPEGGERCRRCYELRLRKTAEEAKNSGYDYFCTTLSISPYKRAEWLNEIGLSLEEEYGVKYLVSDFKKKGGYKRSIELSEEYGLYRQNYCGCVFSKIAREKYDAERAKQADNEQNR